MKIYGCWICYNNIATIKQSIESVYDYIDELVVVDGSFDGKTSDDGTWEAVEDMKFNGKPIIHVKSKASTLYDKHNEHVAITGNKNPDVWTWQVDSDEVYLPKHAKYVHKLIKTNVYDGIGVKLITLSRIDEEGIFYTHNDIMTAHTTQMRIYRMKDGLQFSTRDGIFEHIIYEDGKPVEGPGRRVHYDNRNCQVFNYHCFDSHEKEVARRKHYKADNPEEHAKRLRSAENNMIAIQDHPLKGVRV